MAMRVVIIGGGAIGSSVASSLARMAGNGADITVIERDPSYRFASSALSASSIRLQFSTPLNIGLSRYGMEVIRNAGRDLVPGADLGYREHGYLILATPEGTATLEQIHAIQRAQDVDVVLMDPAQMAARFPWISTEGLGAGSFGQCGEGWFDGYGLLQAFRGHARANGVRYVTGEATALDMSGNHVTGVRLGDGTVLPCDFAVNAAGPWAARVAAMAGIDLPVRARRRMVHVFDCRGAAPHDGPLVGDISGIWFRPEGRQFIAGSSPKAGEPDPDDLPLEVDAHDFDDVVWPALATRVPAFEAIKCTGGWAGYYEMNTVDANGITGLHPDCNNLLFANGFSGHGLQHSPGIGRGIAELIAFGAYKSLDLSPLSFARILEGRPYPEINVI